MKSLLFIPLLFCAFHCFGQSSDIKINNDYFLLGTLNDYMGRDKYSEVANRVDEYYPNEKPLVSVLDSIYKNSYPDLALATSPQTGRLELRSTLLSQKINDFYDFQPSGRGTYCGKADFKTLNLDSLAKTPDFHSKYFESVYTGSVKTDIFTSDSERFSFIAGAYIRFGGKKDSLYYISISNSTSKVKVLAEQLKYLKCTNVDYVIKKDYIPCGHTVYFTPTEELRNYLETSYRKQGHL
ncbi:hypothetical protein [Paludibacter jiangxiensis]|uniref:Uncharacterized protein n=1 Tax=Paludibacter jiangxiensis TaxID=681398 RepID=A0A161L7Q1_9BACT|nr:hypothetical protein [Paludibacter jiangxiensis]GAT62824.1 hypothetical protein PJIAN_3134 [Paludibacter jiangxiensis]